MRPRPLYIHPAIPENRAAEADRNSWPDRRWISAGLVFALAALILTAGCGRQPKPGATAADGSSFSRILVPPFQQSQVPDDKSACVRCPVCGHMFRPGSVPSTAGEMMSAELIAWLTASVDKQIVRPSSPDAVEIPPTECDETRRDTVERLVAAGRRADADAVIIGYLFRFDERVGNDYAASRTASVAFDLHLIDVKSGDIVWKADFDETQRSLSENLVDIDLFIKRRGRWVTADEMARNGLIEMLETHLLP